MFPASRALGSLPLASAMEDADSLPAEGIVQHRAHGAGDGDEHREDAKTGRRGLQFFCPW